jgi:hypothetical protein
MFDLRPPASADLLGPAQMASPRPRSTSLAAASPRDRQPCQPGCGLLDGIRHGIISHGWTLPGLAHRTELPQPMLRSIMDWRPGLTAADAVWWSLELDALAAADGRRFHCLSGRRPTVRLGELARSLLRRNGGTWTEFAGKAAGPNSGGLQSATASGWGGESQLGILDRMAVAGGVAPVLLSA